MAKVSGPYKSLVRGVSEQVPEERLPGQHAEQLNMLSDPVRGLVRRQGTVHVRENPLSVAAADVEDWAADLGLNFTSRDFVLDTREMTMHMRRAGTSGPADPVFLLDRGAAVDGAVVPTVMSTGARTLLADGVVGHAVVGRYLLLAHNQVVGASSADAWGAATNKQKAVIQIRTGSYSRTYRIKIKMVGAAEVAVAYTTPTASYQGVLDTSDILTADPDYQKKVNDRVNAYQAAVTQWLGTAAAAIQPQAIASELAALLNASALTLGRAVTVSGNMLDISTASSTYNIEYVRVEDSGDGNAIRATWQTVEDPAHLPAVGLAGHVVRVQPQRDGEVYYLQAVGAGSGMTEVRWQETAGTTGSLTNPFCVGTVFDGSLILGASAADLQAMLNLLSAGITVPTTAERAAGDADTNPLPYFAGRQITYLGVFQDRLAVGSGPVMNFSRIGDYFNFFKASVLTVKDDDPVEVYSTGSEDDVIRHGVFFDRNLVLFGDKQQYPISGKVPLTPATATMIQSSSHKDATQVRPISQGDLVFYVKSRDGGAGVYQIAVGNVDDTTNSTEVTQQLDSYIVGQPLDLIGLSMPDTVIVRASGNQYGLYLLRYIDAISGERVLESWSRWEFSEAAGKVVGIGVYKDKLRITFARKNADGTALYLAVDEAALVPGAITEPHLDSRRLYTVAAASPAFHGMHVAYGDSSVLERSWQGTGSNDPTQLFDEVGEGADCYAGLPFNSYTTLTSPYPRDSNDAVITIGRTVVNQLVISFAKTAGFGVLVKSNYEDETVMTFRGYVIGADTNRVGQLSLQRGTQTAVVGREVREYEASIVALDWLPVNITAVDWVGQYMNNVRRV